LGLLVLFPLGALSMAQAIQDSRAAIAAADAGAIAEIRKLRNDPQLLDPTDGFDDLGVPGLVLSQQNPKWEGPSYPVYVDPLWQPLWPTVGPFSDVGPPFASPGIPRRSVSYVKNDPLPSQAYRRWFTLQDDLNFKEDGTPFGSPNFVQREGRYTWAYMLRRPRFSTPSELTGIVYNGRPTLALAEHAYGPVTFRPNTNTVTVTWNPSRGKEKPPVRVGSWVLDATVVKQVGPTNYVPDPYGFFYRVLNITEDSATQVTLELQTPIKHNRQEPSPPPHIGVLVVLEGAVEVFEKGAGWIP